MTDMQRYIVTQLVGFMHGCQRRGVSFADCLAEARKQYQKELREKADATPLEK